MTTDHEGAPAVTLLREAASRQMPLGPGVDVEQVRRGGARRLRRCARRRSVAVTATATAAVVAAVVVGTSLVGGPGRVLPAGLTGTTAQEELALLSGPEGREDALPGSWADGSETRGIQLAAGTSRLVGRLGEASFYAGTDDRGEVCLVVSEPDGIGMSCAEPGLFAEDGVWVSGGGLSGEQTIGVLLPDRLVGVDLDQLPVRVREAGGFPFEPADVVAPNLFASATYDQEYCCTP